MSVAIFSSLQDSRHATTRIQSTLDGLHGHMEGLVRDASRAGLQEAIRELKEEAWAFRGRGSEVESGFTNGEAEKIISNVRTFTLLPCDCGCDDAARDSSSTNYQLKKGCVRMASILRFTPPATAL